MNVMSFRDCLILIFILYIQKKVKLQVQLIYFGSRQTNYQNEGFQYSYLKQSGYCAMAKFAL